MSNQQSARPGRNTRRAGAISHQQKYCVLAAGCWLLMAGTGCAVLEPIKPHIFHTPLTPVAELPDDGYRDVTGVIHIHTTYSHDAQGRFEDVVRVANAQGLDYCIVTDHNTLQGLRDGKQGWYGAVLVLIGDEISTQSGHYLALNVHEEIDRTTRTTQQIIDEVNRQGGLGFIAHPYFKHGRWRDWTVHGFTGIEGYNVAHDTLDENTLRLALWTLTVPAEPFYLSILDRPYDPLSAWDHLIAQHGRVVGIGSSDAHEFHILGVKFAPYEDMFQLARTHLLVPAASTLTDTLVYDALRQGHAYFSIDLVANAGGFRFDARKGKRILGVMGDAVPFSDGLELIAVLPAAAQLALYKDGVQIATTIGQSWIIPVTAPGVYRLEAARNNKPWIFSNPIYVEAAISSQQTADSTE